MYELLNNLIGQLPHSEQFLIPIIYIILILLLLSYIVRLVGFKL